MGKGLRLNWDTSKAKYKWLIHTKNFSPTY